MEMECQLSDAAKSGSGNEPTSPSLTKMTNACHKALSLKLENVHVTRKCNQKCEHISIVLRAGLATVL